MTGTLTPVLMASIWASRSLIFQVVDSSCCLGAQLSRQGDFSLLLISSPSIPGVLLDDQDFDEEEELSRLDGDLVIDIAGFCSNVPDLYFDGFGIHHLPNVGGGKIIELLEWVL